MQRHRCGWANGDPLLEAYHDEEWGTPLHDDHKHFEFLSLEVMQCGLSWMTVLRKREAMREAFDGFDYEKIAAYGENKMLALLNFPGIIHSLAKIRALIDNAHAFLEIQRQYGSFDRYLWGFVDGQVQRYPEGLRCRPHNELSETISKDLKKRGFRYLGRVTVYSHLQAAGLIDDHDPDCYKCGMGQKT